MLGAAAPVPESCEGRQCQRAEWAVGCLLPKRAWEGPNLGLGHTALTPEALQGLIWERTDGQMSEGFQNSAGSPLGGRMPRCLNRSWGWSQALVRPP